MAGISLDTLRPLLGHCNRSTTYRYASIDRLAIGKVLKVLPSIGEEDESKKWPQPDNDRDHFGKNWQDFQGEHLFFLPEILVNPCIYWWSKVNDLRTIKLHIKK